MVALIIVCVLGADGSADESRECRIYKRVTTPAQMKAELPADAAALALVEKTRTAIRNILDNKDQRLLAVVGPCSIHDRTAAIEFAQKLATLSKELSGQLVIIMRTYFEKPRTRLGWKVGHP